jgi:sulfatase maturation enzyme AslB (radical SAM superfamily)
MFQLHSIRCAVAMTACFFALAYSIASFAQDVASFATGGYASGLRSKKLMDKIDTNGDGMISKDEWIAYQEKVFTILDKHKTGRIDAKTFVDPSGGDDLVRFSTGGYASGLRTKAMMHKIDTDGDGTISHDEYIAFQIKIFDMLNTSKVHKGMLSPQELFATGGVDPR